MRRFHIIMLTIKDTFQFLKYANLVVFRIFGPNRIFEPIADFAFLCVCHELRADSFMTTYGRLPVQATEGTFPQSLSLPFSLFPSLSPILCASEQMETLSRRRHVLYTLVLFCD